MTAGLCPEPACQHIVFLPHPSVVGGNDMVELPWAPFLAINESGDHVFVAVATPWV
jgi:hypothetical protein